MSHFLQNPPPQRVLTFYKAFNHTKNGVRLISTPSKPAVCLHYETQLTHHKQVKRS